MLKAILILYVVTMGSLAGAKSVFVVSEQFAADLILKDAKSKETTLMIKLYCNSERSSDGQTCALIETNIFCKYSNWTFSTEVFDIENKKLKLNPGFVGKTLSFSIPDGNSRLNCIAKLDDSMLPTTVSDFECDSDDKKTVFKMADREVDLMKKCGPLILRGREK